MASVAFFDLDDTLTHEGFALSPPVCDDAVAVLEKCRAAGLKVAVVSHNSDAEAICANTGLGRYVDAYFAWGAYDKRQHLADAMRHFGAAPHECIFFDDLRANVACARQLGVRAVLVDWKKGVTVEDFVGAWGGSSH